MPRKNVKKNADKASQEETLPETPKKKVKVESLPGLVVPKIQNIKKEAIKYYDLLKKGISGTNLLHETLKQIRKCSDFKDAVSKFESGLK
jgi:hypothetical protein